MTGGRAGNTKVHFRRACIAHHLHDLEAGGTADDGIVNQHDTFAFHQQPVGIMLALHASMARSVRWLDEGAADIMRADDAKFKRYSALLRIPDGGRNTAIGHGHHQVGIAGHFARQFRTDVLAAFIDAALVENGIGPAEIDMLENAGSRTGFAKGAVGLYIAVEIHLHQFAGIDLTSEFGAHHVQRHGFAGEHHGIAQFAHYQRADAHRIAAGGHSARCHYDKRIGALDQSKRIHQLVAHSGVATRGDQMDDDFGIGGGLEDRPLADQFLPQLHGVRDIAVVRHGKSATGKIGIQRLDVAHAGTAGGGIAHMPARHMTGQFGNRFF